MRSRIGTANLGYDMEFGRIDMWLEQVGDRILRCHAASDAPRLSGAAFVP